MISLKIHAPSPLLSQYVKMHLFAEVDNPDLHESLVTPRGFHALVTPYRKQSPGNFVAIDFSPGLRPPNPQDDGMYLIGHYTKSFQVYSKGKFSILYTIFQPHGAAAFFGTSQQQFTNACVPLTDLGVDVPVAQVMEDLFFARDYSQRVRIMETMLAGLLRKRTNESPDRFGQVACWIMGQGGNVSVQKIADECGMSKRTLERRFIEILGVSPKQYTKIVRFRSVLQMLQTQPLPPDWHDLLHRTHYYDQSHFIHDFQDFTGKSPSAFFQMERDLDDAFVRVVR